MRNIGWDYFGLQVKFEITAKVLMRLEFQIHALNTDGILYVHIYILNSFITAADEDILTIFKYFDFFIQ